MKMAKVVVYALLIIAFILFSVFSQIKLRDHNHGRRFGYKIYMPTFHPLLSEIRKIDEEKELNAEINNSSHNTEVEDEYDFFSEEGRFNITLRLLYLFPLIDNAPKDGFVSLKELENWNIAVAIHRLSYRTEKEMELGDKDGDGAISFQEYLPQFSEQDIEKNGMVHAQAGWWKEQFDNADVDGNGNLNFDEFNSFLHPEDSNNDAIHKWLLREEIDSVDNNNDEKLNLDEFRENIYKTYKNYAEFEDDGTNFPTAEEIFAELDVNKDKYLEVEELKPIFRYLHPGEISYAKYYSRHLIQEADDNKDGNLTLDEMLNHEYEFYNTVYNDVDDEDDLLGDGALTQETINHIILPHHMV